jgi:hypothetical protein
MVDISVCLKMYLNYPLLGNMMTVGFWGTIFSEKYLQLRKWWTHLLVKPTLHRDFRKKMETLCGIFIPRHHAQDSESQGYLSPAPPEKKNTGEEGGGYGQ